MTILPVLVEMAVSEKPADKVALLYRLYHLLLQKYADLINEKERRTIGEVKALIDPADLTVQSLAFNFKGDSYSFETNFLSAAKRAFEFVSHEISFVKADVRLSFWLSAKEMVESKVADDEDQAVFVCSLLSALGDESAAVVIAELEDLSTHAFVISQYQSGFYLWDPAQRHDFLAFSGSKQTALENYSFEGIKIRRFLYKFNRLSYEQFL